MSITHRILSLDGGGVRGLVELTLLTELEKILRQRVGDNSARIIDYFDLVAGTSVGSIIGGLLVLPNLVSFGNSLLSTDPYTTQFDAGQVRDFFLQKAPLLFTKSKTSLGGWWGAEYDDATFNSLLKGLAGEIRLSQLSPSVLFPAWDYPTGKPVLMTNIPGDSGIVREDFLLSDAVRASASAPDYFPPADIQSINGVRYLLGDGGLYANNPGMLAMTEAYPNTINNTFVLSIGTGANTPSYQPTANWGKLDWVVPAINIQLAASGIMVNRDLTKLFGSGTGVGVGGQQRSYVRMNPVLTTASQAMDDCSTSNMQKLIDDTMSYIQVNTDVMNNIIDALLMPANPSRMNRRYFRRF